MKKQHWDEVFEPLLDAAHKIGRNLADHQRKMKEKVSEFLGDLDAVDGRGADRSHTVAALGGRPGRGDELVPRPECLTPDGEIDWSQAPHGGYTLDADGNPIFDRHSPSAGDMFDRYGDESGRYVSPLGEDGRFPYETRSLPYVQNENAYHQYEWKQDLSALPDAYDAADSATKDKVDALMAKFDLSMSDLVNVKRGEAAPAFGEPGGAVQHELPMSVSLLRELDMVGPVGR